MHRMTPDELERLRNALGMTARHCVERFKDSLPPGGLEILVVVRAFGSNITPEHWAGAVGTSDPRVLDDALIEALQETLKLHKRVHAPCPCGAPLTACSTCGQPTCERCAMCPHLTPLKRVH